MAFQRFVTILSRDLVGPCKVLRVLKDMFCPVGFHGFCWVDVLSNKLDLVTSLLCLDYPTELFPNSNLTCNRLKRSGGLGFLGASDGDMAREPGMGTVGIGQEHQRMNNHISGSSPRVG